jgi:rod shape determining protein RodA
MRLSSWRHFDYWLLGAVCLLLIFGIVMIDSAIAGNIELVEENVVRKQMIFAGIGLAAVFIFTFLDYHIWVALGRILYIFVVGFLLWTMVAGESAFGAERWIDLGFVQIQPSELAKIAVILIAADYFARNKHRMVQFQWIIRSGIFPLGMFALIFLQPDLSTAIVIVVIWAAMVFAIGIKLNHLLLLGFLAVVVAGASFPFLQDYQKQRIVNLLVPDPEERYGENYNVDQALITIGSGGWSGEGYKQGSQVQLRFLKVRDTDFIFAVISEEFGFFGAVGVMILFIFIIYRILRAAYLANDPFGSMICYGVATLISFQVLVNIGMNLQLLPVTGLPLPFISRGGSSIITVMMAIGLVESVIARHKLIE